MVTNANRKLIETRDFDFIRVRIYSTGAVYFTWIDRQDVLVLTNATDLVSSGYVWKIAQLLVHDDSARVLSSYRRALQLEYIPARLSEGVRYILDAELEPEAKLIYFISFISMKFKLATDELDTLFAKRPSPRGEWETYSESFRPKQEILISHAIMPGFYSPSRNDSSIAAYKGISRTSAFIHSSKPIARGDFMAAHEQDYFVPHLASIRNEELYATTSSTFTNDLHPAQFVRFVQYFKHDLPSELHQWARDRYDSGIMTLREHRDKGTRNLFQMNTTGWISMLEYLTLEESKEFQLLVRESGGFGELFSGVDQQLAGLIAYYYTAGGVSKLKELFSHILAHGPGVRDDFQMGRRIQRNWQNPYDRTKALRPKLGPYVAALNSEYKDLPLELALVSL